MTYSLQYLGLDPSKPQTTQETFPWWQFPFVNNEKTDWPGRFNQIRKCTFFKKNDEFGPFIEQLTHSLWRSSKITPETMPGVLVCSYLLTPISIEIYSAATAAVSTSIFAKLPVLMPLFSSRFLFSFFSLSIFQPVRSHASLSLDFAFMGFSCINVWIWNACGVRLDKVSYKR